VAAEPVHYNHGLTTKLQPTASQPLSGDRQHQQCNANLPPASRLIILFAGENQ